MPSQSSVLFVGVLRQGRRFRVSRFGQLRWGGIQEQLARQILQSWIKMKGSVANDLFEFQSSWLLSWDTPKWPQPEK